MSAAYPELAPTAEFRPQYDLTDSELLELSGRLLQEQPTGSKARFVVYEFDGTNEFSNLARTVESRIFGEAFNDKVDDMEEGYGPYEASSSFFLLMDQAGKRPVGALRIIRDSEAGFKTLNDIVDEPLSIPTEAVRDFHNIDDMSTVWDVGTVAVLPEFRTSPLKSSLSRDPQPNIMLYRSLYAKARYEGIEHFVAVIDDRALKGLKLLGVPFVPINDSEPFKYMGSEVSHALYGRVSEFFDKMESRYEHIKEQHRFKSVLLARPLGQLMLGNRTDDKLFLDYK